MGNSINNKSDNYHNTFYTSLNNDEILNIRKNYKVIDVDWLDFNVVNYTILGDNYFTLNKKEVINNMLKYYINDKDKQIYEKTDYLCNEKEKICICNTHAEDFRKIYEQNNYQQNKKYISWCKKVKNNY